MSAAGRPAVAFRTFELSDPRFERDDLRQVTVKSLALGMRADLTVHAPPAARAARDVSLVILLHGVYGSHWAWSRQGGAHFTAAWLQAAGEIPPLVLAMPSDGLWGDGSGYLPHRTQDFERWIVEEVPVVVARAVPNFTRRSALCIGGLSMGGFGALRLGAKYPGIFRACSGHSSLTHLDQMRDFVAAIPETSGVPREELGLLSILLRHRARLPALRFDCGTEDPLIESNRALHAALVEAGVAHVYEEFPGGHTWAYWETHLAATLRFFGGVLAAATSPAR